MHDELMRHNRRASVLLLVFGFLLLAVIAAALQILLLGGIPTGGGMLGIGAVAMAVAGIGSLIGWWSSDRIALAASKAKPADPNEYRQLHNLVEGLCIASGLTKPRVYVVHDPAPNAFATGRDEEHAAIAVTTGLLERMSRTELEGVLAHELSHIRNKDLLVGTLAVTFASAAVLLSELGLRGALFGGGRRRGGRGGAGAIALVAALVAVVIGPLVVRLVHFAVSRQREYLADASAVELTRNPAGMVAALEHLRQDGTVVRSGTKATSHLWIEEPVDQSKRINRMFASHPPLDDRIARLQALYDPAVRDDG